MCLLALDSLRGRMTPGLALTVLLSWLALGSTLSQGSDIVSIYVDTKSPAHRIEFLPDGGYYEVRPWATSGTYQAKKDALVCADKVGGRMEFRQRGKNLVDADGNQWTPRGTRPKLPWKDVSPVSFVVVDSKTRAPINEFSYTYSISTSTEKYDPLIVRPIDVRSKDGTFSLSAPRSCEIGMRIEGSTIIGGYGTWRKYVLTSDNKQRKIEVQVETGAVVEGVVVDSRTARPIEGALVSPLIFSPPGFSPDRNRGVRTDAQGKFRIGGISMPRGINIWHADYMEFKRDKFTKFGTKTSENSYTARVELGVGETITGVVKDASGNPLPDVEVSDWGGKSVRTGKDGSFALRSPSSGPDGQAYRLSFRKEGYVDTEVSQESHISTWMTANGHLEVTTDPNHPPQALSIVLEPQPLLNGRVLGPDGRPVARFTVVAGPGRDPRDRSCSSQVVSGSEGRFALRVRADRDYQHDDKLWIGAKAPELARWETVIDSWRSATAITVRLKPGVAVRGSVQNPNAHGQMVAKLVPYRPPREAWDPEILERQELGRMETAVDSRGAFRFDHIGSGSYLLAVSGPAISPISTEIAVHETDVDVGTLAARGRGVLAGVVFQPEVIREGDKYRLDPKRHAWPFADGHVSFHDSSGRCNAAELDHLKPIAFKADEHGRFRLSAVPIGSVSVDIPVDLTPDVTGAHSRIARIVEGKLTEVSFFDPSGNWDFACQFLIGDGSPAQYLSGTGMGAKRKIENVNTRPPLFRVELVPKGDLPLSFGAAGWEELDERKQIVLPDVHPGNFHVVVGDWLGSTTYRATLYERDVEIKPTHSTVTVSLGAGSITGAVQCSKNYEDTIQVAAFGQKSHAIRYARCDNRGSFCVRYLPPDDYILFAHDDSAGWCKHSEVRVANNISDTGSHKLVVGGVIVASVPPELAMDRSVHVVATDPQGIAIEGPIWVEPPGQRFAISGLWPSKWVVTLRTKDQVLATKAVVLRDTESVPCDLMAK
jgi:hypothetical protein